MATLYLLRHAQSAPCIKTPEADWPLSSLGENQARDIAPYLATLDVNHVFTSPYKRCLQTISHFKLKNSTKAHQVHNKLHERIVSTAFIEDFRNFWVRSWEDFDYAIEGGESSRDCQNRIVQALTEISTEFQGEKILVSSHGAAIGLFLNHLDPQFGREDCERLRNPDLKKVTFSKGRFTWDTEFRPHSDFANITTSYHHTPLIGETFARDK